MADKAGLSGASEILSPILTSSPVAKSALGATITAYLAFVAPVLAALTAIGTLILIYYSIKEKRADTNLKNIQAAYQQSLIDHNEIINLTLKNEKKITDFSKLNNHGCGGLHK